MATINGVPVNFAFPVGPTITELTGKMLLQDAETTDDAQMELTRDGTGEEAVHGHYGFKKNATLTYVVTATDTIANAKINTVKPAIGTFITITASPEMPELFQSGKTKWEVMKGGKTAKGNANSAKITLNLEWNLGIQAVAT